MSYDKHTWVDNETITAAKLNNIEDGIAEAESSGGYDGELYIYSSGGGLSVERKMGNFVDLAAKLQNNIPPNILVKVWDGRMDHYCYTTTNAVAVYSSDFNSSSPYITFTVNAINSGGTLYPYFPVYWDAEDEVHFD